MLQSEYYKGTEVELLDDVNLSYVQSDGYDTQKLHWHKNYELLIIYNGDYLFEANGRIIRSNKPGIFFIPPYTLHVVIAYRSTLYTRRVVSFSRNMRNLLASLMPDESILRSSSLIYLTPGEEDLEELADIFERLCGYYLRARTADSIMCRICLSYIMRKVSILHGSGLGEEIAYERSYIQDALIYVGDKLGEQIGISELAARFGVGQTKFCADFKRTTGSTYKKYITELRQTLAQNLLLAGMSILAVSLELGYSSESHFIRAFREYWGVTPAEFVRGGKDISRRNGDIY